MASIQLRTVTDQFKTISAGFRSLRSAAPAAAAGLRNVVAAGFGGGGGGSGGGGAGGKNTVSQLADSLKGLVDRLFPAEAALRTFNEEFAKLEAAHRGGLISGDKLRQALDRLQADFMGNRADGGMPKVLQNWADESSPFTKVSMMTEEMASRIRVANDNIRGSFVDMADATLNALDRLAGSIRGGGFLDILGAALGMLTQLGSIGLFGKGIAANINAPRIPAYANGTNWHPGGMALVGERGPELVNLPRGASVTPNGQFGGQPMNITVTPSKYFDVHVNGQIMQAAPAIAQAGGEIGVRRVGAAQGRTLR